MSAASGVAVPARSLARTSLGLLPIQIGLRAGEALFPVLLAAWFGRNAGTDAFNLVAALFTLVGALAGGLYRDSALVPIIAEERRSQPAEVPRLLGALLAHSLAGGAALATFVGGAAWVWLERGARGVALPLGGVMIAAFASGLVTATARSLLEGALHAHGRFRAPPAGSALGMAAALGVLAAARHALGLAVVPLALLAGDAAALALLAGACARAGLRFPLSFARPPAARRFARRAAAQVAGAAITRVNPLVDQAMAAAAGVVGGGTLLRLSQDVSGVPASLVQAALLPALLTRLSAEIAARRHDRHRATTAGALAAVAGLLAAATLALFALRGPLLSLVYLHGSMDAAGVARLGRLLPYHLVGVVPFGVLLVLVRAHTSLGASRIMLVLGVVNCALNALLNLLLRPLLGLEGIALSTSLVSVAIALLLWLRLRRARVRLGAEA